MAKDMMQTPTGNFSQAWPEPQRFPQFLDKMGKMMGGSYAWSADVKQLPIPVLLVYADNDSVSQKHIAKFFALLGGVRKSRAGRTRSSREPRLAIIPGYSHYFITSIELAPTIEKYLADPLTNPPAGSGRRATSAPPLPARERIGFSGPAPIVAYLRPVAEFTFENRPSVHAA